jgi:transposase
MDLNVGIDISARSSEMSWRQGGRTLGGETIEHTVQGRKAAISKLLSLKPLCVVMEATGIYYLDLAMEFHAAGLPVSVINPKSSHHFARLKMSHTKTDAADAQLLAEYAECMKPRLWTPPTEQRLMLRDIGRYINRLIGDRTAAKNRRHALESTKTTPKFLLEDAQDGIDMLDKRIDQMRERAHKHLLTCPDLSAQFANIVAAKGIGAASAITILAELAVLPTTLKAPQISKYAGLDVQLCRSGTSVNRAARMSKAGNAYLRSAMYMPALSAVRYDIYAKAFYEALLSRGKKKKQALGAVMRKYLTGIWACMRSGNPFDAAKLFSEEHLNKA